MVLEEEEEVEVEEVVEKVVEEVVHDRMLFVWLCLGTV